MILKINMKKTLEQQEDISEQTLPEVHDTRGALERLFALGVELTPHMTTAVSDTLHVAHKSRNPLDELREQQRLRIADRKKRGVTLDLAGLSDRIYPQPKVSGFEKAGQNETEKIRIAQQERLRKKEQQRVESQKIREYTQMFIQESLRAVMGAFSEYHVIQKQLNGVRGRFSQFTKLEKSQFKILSEHAIHLLYSVSERKQEIFACLKFLQDQEIGTVILSARQLTDYFQGSQNQTLACATIRQDLSFDPARDADSMKKLEEIEFLEDNFRSMLVENLSVLRPGEDATTQTRPTHDLQKELIALTKRIGYYSQEPGDSLLRTALQDRFTYLEQVLRERKLSGNS